MWTRSTWKALLIGLFNWGQLSQQHRNEGPTKGLNPHAQRCFTDPQQRHIRCSQSTTHYRNKERKLNQSVKVCRWKSDGGAGTMKSGRNIYKGPDYSSKVRLSDTVWLGLNLCLDLDGNWSSVWNRDRNWSSVWNWIGVESLLGFEVLLSKEMLELELWQPN